ncbi:MAG: hypothetical protein U5K79_16470 [Cyclobacteriaceae bacterium]|nr:hypothetical protein [Cyclobacteriaceae bacterium]
MPDISTRVFPIYFKLSIESLRSLPAEEEITFEDLFPKEYSTVKGIIEFRYIGFNNSPSPYSRRDHNRYPFYSREFERVCQRIINIQKAEHRQENKIQLSLERVQDHLLAMQSVMISESF